MANQFDGPDANASEVNNRNVECFIFRCRN
ncbi:hypothetical protein F01_70003 [Burkholderia cenocepacia]|nr:hypothetical protein F01_70003 [Burkholderia cenocepacia]